MENKSKSVYTLGYVPNGYFIEHEFSYMVIYQNGDRVISFIYSPSGLDTIRITSDGKTLDDIMR